MRPLLTAIIAVLLVAPAASRQIQPLRVAAGADLQAVINRAKGGDTILLERGAAFSGSYVLPVHEGDAFVTIRTDAADELPPPGVRTSPRYAGILATISSPTNEPALRTAVGAHHWRIENVEFGPNRNGDGNVISFGDGPPRQVTPESVPQALVLDRVYVHGHPELGQKRGIALNSGATEIRNSYIAEIKSTGVDTQAIGGWNGPGPFTIENNYLEAAGENIMFGGADPGIDGLVPTDITIRGNHITRPVAWREPILAAPADVRVMPAAGEGSLAEGTYIYKVVAERPAGQGELASSAPAAADAVTVSLGTAALTVTWTAVPGARAYRVYRTVTGTPAVFFRVTEPAFTDTGVAGTAGTPRPNATVWQVKNLLELKSARRVRIDGNLFEHHWAGAQPGYALLFKPVNQSGGAPWSTIEDVQFTNNVVRHVGGGININGTDPDRPSARAGTLVIRNNLFVIDRGRWGGPGDFLQIGSGPAEVVVERNTVIHDGRVLSLYSGRKKQVIDRLVFTGNLLRHNQYGVKGDGTAVGRASLDAYSPAAVFRGNVLAGGERSRYPDGNRFVGEREFDELFVDAPGADYRVRREGPEYAGAGVDWNGLAGALTAGRADAAAPAAGPE